jgi:hypothetical protein
MGATLETFLHPVVEQFLKKASCHVKGEVNGCDAVAVKNDEPPQLAIVGMKRGFNLDLLLQAVDRMRIADEAWLVVPRRTAVVIGILSFDTCVV